MNSHMNKNDKRAIYCNCCGRAIADNADYLHIEKAWGYFSNKDLKGHAFNICEECYDNWTENFLVPVDEFPVDEIHLYSEEELEKINAAYLAELNNQ